MSRQATTTPAAGSWLSSPPPAGAVEIAAGLVTAVAVAGSGRTTTVQSHASVALDPAAVTPALNATNVHDTAALAAAIRAAVDGLSPRPRRVALVLPDTVGKVSILRFEKVPARASDLDQLIHWQVRKAAPYRIEDAQLSWIPGAAEDGGGREFIVTTVRRDIVAEYERACDAAGLHAGIVDLATMNLINLALATAEEPPSGDWLLVHVAADYATLAVMRGGDLVFFRNRSGADPAELVELVHQTAMYHEDRLGGGGFARVVMAGAAQHGPGALLRAAVHERLGLPIEPLDVTRTVGFADRIAAPPELTDRLGPALGVLLRERVA